jgi:uncharacterized membrane protein YkvA (DUF1232 family)
MAMGATALVEGDSAHQRRRIQSRTAWAARRRVRYHVRTRCTRLVLRAARCLRSSGRRGGWLVHLQRHHDPRRRRARPAPHQRRPGPATRTVACHARLPSGVSLNQRRCSPAPGRLDDRCPSEHYARVRTIVLLAASFAFVWLAFVMFVWLIRPDNTSIGDAARLLPDTLRLVRRLSADRSIPRTTRCLVWALLVYLATPIDLVPDFIPVIGYADDAIITSFVLRHVIARAGTPKLREHWPGSEDGLSSLVRILRLRQDP